MGQSGSTSGSGLNWIIGESDDEHVMRIFEMRVKNGSLKLDENGVEFSIMEEDHNMKVFPNWLVVGVEEGSEANEKGVKPGWVSWRSKNVNTMRVCSSKLIFSDEYITTALETQSLAEKLRDDFEITGQLVLQGEMLVGWIDGKFSHVDTACDMLKNSGNYKDATFNDLVDIPMTRRLYPVLSVSLMSGKELKKAIASMFFTLRAGIGSKLNSFEDGMIEEIKSGLEASDVMDTKVLEKALRSDEIIKKKMDKHKKKKELRAMYRNIFGNQKKNQKSETEGVEKSDSIKGNSATNRLLCGCC